MRVLWMVAVALILGCSLAALMLCAQGSETGAAEGAKSGIAYSLARLGMDATAIATFFLFLVTCGLLRVNWLAANAAKQSADVAAREFRLSREPLVRVECRGLSVAGDVVCIWGTIAEVAGVPTRLHRVAAVGHPNFDPPVALPPTVTEPNVTLRGEQRTRNFGVRVAVGRSSRDAIVPVAAVCVDVTISVPAVDSARQTWRMAGPLQYDGPNGLYILPDLDLTCVDPEQGEERGYGRRIADPVLRAWERWWDRVC